MARRRISKAGKVQIPPPVACDAGEIVDTPLMAAVPLVGKRAGFPGTVAVHKGKQMECAGFPGTVAVHKGKQIECAGLVSSDAQSNGPLSGDQTKSKDSHNVQISNPFAILDSDIMIGTPSDRRDVNPGPMKRARPEETLAQRAIPKSANRRGKASLGKVNLPVRQSAALHSVPLPGSSGLPSEGQGEDQNVRPRLMSSEGHSHETIVSRLKLAIMGQDSDSSLSVDGPLIENEREVETEALEPNGSSLSFGSHANGSMEEDSTMLQSPPMSE